MTASAPVRSASPGSMRRSATFFACLPQHPLSIVASQGGVMRELTDKQQEVLGFIRTFVAKHGVPPTVREIGGRFNVTPRAAFDHLRALERKGALQRRVGAGEAATAVVAADTPAART